MSYKYINGYYEVTTPIYKEFQRFHSMNAQYAYIRDDDNNIDNWDFISYAMPICTVAHDKNKGMWAIHIANDAFEQSSSTNRQIARFLREIGSPFTVSELRRLIDSGFACEYDNKDNAWMYVRYDVVKWFAVTF